MYLSTAHLCLQFSFHPFLDWSTSSALISGVMAGFNLLDQDRSRCPMGWCACQASLRHASASGACYTMTSGFSEINIVIREKINYISFPTGHT